MITLLTCRRVPGLPPPWLCGARGRPGDEARYNELSQLSLSTQWTKAVGSLVSTQTHLGVSDAMYIHLCSLPRPQARKEGLVHTACLRMCQRFLVHCIFLRISLRNPRIGRSRYRFYIYSHQLIANFMVSGVTTIIAKPRGR